MLLELPLPLLVPPALEPVEPDPVDPDPVDPDPVDPEPVDPDPVDPLVPAVDPPLALVPLAPAPLDEPDPMLAFISMNWLLPEPELDEPLADPDVAELEPLPDVPVAPICPPWVRQPVTVIVL